MVFGGVQGDSHYRASVGGTRSVKCHKRFGAGHLTFGPVGVICLESTGLDTLVDPLRVEDNLSFLTGILAIEALTTFAMRVNCDRGKGLFEHLD